MKHNILKVEPPQAEKKIEKLKKHGDVRQDPYFWMRERDSKKVLAHIEEENAYAAKVLKGAGPIADTLFEEMKQRIKQDESTPAYKKGDYYYYTRYESGREYPIYCRKYKNLEAKEEIILDINELAKGHSYYSAHLVATSPNHNLITFAVDTVGRRFYTLHFKDLKSGNILETKIPKTTGQWVWFNDNQSGLFVKQDEKTLRADKVYRFHLKEAQPKILVQEKDELFSLGVGRSLNGKTLMIESSSFDSSELMTLDANQPQDKPQVFQKRSTKHLYDLRDAGDRFYIISNKEAENFQVLKRLKAGGDWKPLIAHRKDFLIEDLLVLKDFIVLEGRKQGLSRIEIYNHSGKKLKEVEFQDESYVAGLAQNRDPEATQVRYTYSSLVTPGTYYDFDIASGQSKLIHRYEIPTYDPELYETKRLWASARDGQSIPVSLVYRKDRLIKGQNPLLQYGYGSYGISMDPSFRSNVISLLDRGFVYAIAHIRGGQELGRFWYEQGRLKHKMNTFHDFIDVTEHLVQYGYAHPKKVYIQGGSAGGLLVGAVINKRPELYRGAHAAVPFVDVLTTMLDETLPLTVGEYEQWGNPNVKQDYEFIKSYSPYDQIKKQNYPHLLVTTGYHDSQVQYWEPLKWVAKLRDKNQGDSLILMRTQMEAGHSGVTGRFARTREVAEEYAFFVWLYSEGL